MALSLASIGQVANYYPNGFRRAHLPAALQNKSITVHRNSKLIDNQVPPIFNTTGVPLKIAGPLQPISLEDPVGCTFYDLQTNNSISNRIVVNDDGTISAVWTTSPTSLPSTTPPYPDRGTGYRYWDGTTWNSTLCPSTREENSRTGFTNIAVTSTGKELIIAHQAVSGTGGFNSIAVSRRATKGTGAWTFSTPFGLTSHDTWPKACAAGDYVYAIWQGSGAGANTATPAPIVAGQSGPIFFTRSQDGGINWDPKIVPTPIDSDYYEGFGGDSYAIDAHDSIVCISFGDTYTDIGLIKSTDYGVTWTKKIVQTHPIPHYTDSIKTDLNADGINDTLYTNSGDSKVLVDNDGMCHVWFSGLFYWNDSIGDGSYSLKWGTDSLEYWNENMATDAYVPIAATQDFNGNDTIDVPQDTSTNCTNTLSWGNYGGGLTQMPSAGIDNNGTIYLTYQAINESADTLTFHQLHRQVYMMTLPRPYDPINWTYPYNIIPDTANGGYGEFQEGVFACVGRHVDAYAHVVYQRDEAPGHALATAGTCDNFHNLGNSSEIIVVKVDAATVGIKSATQNNLFVSQNYPNPVKGMTYINVGLKKASDIKFEVFDLIGKSVYSENRKQANTGTHTINLNTSSFRPGIYTYTVSADGQKTTRKMIVQ